MARIRYLKPEFFFDEDLADLDYVVRLAFQGLWVNADKAGRVCDSPKKLKALIFPYDEVDMDDLLFQLEKKPFINRYEVDDKKYIQILNWDLHQKPHHTEKDSVIPGDMEKGKIKIKKKIKQVKATCELSNGELTVKERLKAFEDIWSKYPNKAGKKAAEKHFISSVLNDQDLKDIGAALKNYLSSVRVKKGYIQNGSTWFNNWRDWVNWVEPECNTVKEDKPNIPKSPAHLEWKEPEYMRSHET